MPESSLQKVMTVMFELAVRHELIHHPDTYVERYIKEIREGMKEIKSLVAISSGTDESLLREILTTVQHLAMQQGTSFTPFVPSEDVTLDMSQFTNEEEEETEMDMDKFYQLIGQGGEESNV
jgi:hypothetical protein